MTDPNQNSSGATSKTEDPAIAADVSADDSNKKLAELSALADKYKNDYLYLRAEFDNYKKHVIKERADMVKYGSERLIIEILGVLDNFDRALELKVTADTVTTYVKGVEMTAVELRNVLQKFGVSEVPCQGQPFDPSVHEALSAEENKSVPSGHISKVFKKPYKLHEKLVRPAQVVVAK